MDLKEKLAPVKARYAELAGKLAQGGLSGGEIVKLSKEYSDLEPVVEAVEAYEKALSDKEEAQEMLSDPEMKEMAEGELAELAEKIPALEEKIKLALLPKDSADTKNAILEIRAGTGGDEAALFAADLFGMYKGYAAVKGWRVEVMSASENDLGGYKEIIVEVSGVDVFSRLKYESGGHRVQRVPKTETQGRIHTSAATVAVLPEAEDVDVQINEADLRIDIYRSSGPGGSP